ncbi:unnamed protein product [Ilex paraguariensis]
MILYHSCGRNRRLEVFKALQLALLLAISIWLLFHIRYLREKPMSCGGNMLILLMGRKGNVGLQVGNIYSDGGGIREVDQWREARLVEGDVEEEESAHNGSEYSWGVNNVRNVEKGHEMEQERASKNEGAEHESDRGSVACCFHDETGVPPDFN